MRLVWPVLEPPLPLFDLIDIAKEDVANVLAQQGFTAVGEPYEWEPKPGVLMPGFVEHRFVITCLVEVARAVREAA